MLLAALLASLLVQGASSARLPATEAESRLRTIAIDEAFAERAQLKVGDRVSMSAHPGASGDTVIIGAIVRRGADPSEVARGDLRVWMHLDQIQKISGYGDRVDRFAIATAPAADILRLIDRINGVAFGFEAYRSRDIAVETSRTFQVVSRFHRAIGIITIVASSVFLLCIMVLKVEERRRDIAALRLMGISRASVMRSIVIDEGFGSLDDETLDEVVDVLDGLREAGRVVGVVSHVAELRTRIPARLFVAKSPAGSSLRPARRRPSASTSADAGRRLHSVRRSPSASTP